MSTRSASSSTSNQAQRGGAAGGGGAPHPRSSSQFHHSRKSSTTSNASSSSAAVPSTSSPAASTSNPDASSSSLPPLQLSELLGTQLRLTLNTGSRDRERPVVSGSLWCYDPSFGSLVLSSANGGYRIVRLGSIQSVQVVPESSKENVDVEMKAINVDRMREREQQGVNNERKRIDREPPPGVSELGKELFEALGKTLPVRWAGTTIVVLDEVLVASPYDPSKPEQVRSNNAQRRDRVVKVLQGERSRLERNRPDLFSQQSEAAPAA